MRDIVFRGKRVIDGKWVEGSLHLVGESAYIFVALDFLEGHGWYAVDPKTVGQYAGLLDVVDGRVFEGDILNISYGSETVVEKTVVEYIGSAFYGSRYDDTWDLDGYAWVEVIGNRWDNPELLEETK